MLDIDRLKINNDRYGHGAEAACCRLSPVRPAAAVGRRLYLLARYGGDEFVILLVNTGAAEAHAVAGRIRTAARNASFEYRGERIETSVSIGIASFPESAGHPEDVLDKADLALYKQQAQRP